VAEWPCGDFSKGTCTAAMLTWLRTDGVNGPALTAAWISGLCIPLPIEQEFSGEPVCRETGFASIPTPAMDALRFSSPGKTSPMRASTAYREKVVFPVLGWGKQYWTESGRASDGQYILKPQPAAGLRRGPSVSPGKNSFVWQLIDNFFLQYEYQRKRHPQGAFFNGYLKGEGGDRLDAWVGGAERWTKGEGEGILGRRRVGQIISSWAK